MASPKTLALRARMDALTPVWLPVEADPTPRSANVSDFAAGQRLRSLRANLRRRGERANANGRRDIPTSGAGRRRAKAWRNRGLCLAADDAGRCPRLPVIHGRCRGHLTPEFLREHGEHHLAALVESGGTLTRGRTYEGDAIHQPGTALNALEQPSNWRDTTDQYARILSEQA